ncbi:peptidase [Deinococcus piscis]|uniref:Peptidase n=1 Tax=Deinococcus piscis TaxID=394230 RepID=A0ABQ3JYW1_9DEIO|nr:prolyl oligopeptidase family serine peptidase [Deinococcus piscis]GHF93999.1 peptidase [Deinococcus piscis]
MRALIILLVLAAVAWLGYVTLTQGAGSLLTGQGSFPQQAERPQLPDAASAQPDRALQARLLAEAVARQPISIQALRAREYPGSALTVERELERGGGYSRQVVSYRSDGLKIYALLTVPDGPPPEGGWPAIVFNHGYIPPAEYRTTERYVAYQDAFARAGFVTLKSDYRGHGDSEGEAGGGYNDPGYTVDVLNAAASLKRDGRVNPARLGLWGHSMGGQLSLRAMLVDRDLKAASLWAGVVADYAVLQTDWHAPDGVQRQLDALNREFLRQLSPNAYLADLNGRPIQLHHGTADKDVPYSFQVALASDLRAAGQGVEAYRYGGDDHNLSGNLALALRRSVEFFQRHL